jgi:hypothetical protein
MKTIYILAALCLILASCARSFYTENDLVRLRKGASPAEINKAFDPEYVKLFRAPKSNIKVYTVDVACSWTEETHDYNKYDPSSSYSDKSGYVRVSETVNTTYTTPFFMVYVDDKLTDWGYKYEFKNDTTFCPYISIF